MSLRIGAFMLMILLFLQIYSVAALTNGLDAYALKAMKNEWIRFPESWEGSDPCGTNWIGITCNNDRVVSISLVNFNLKGKLSSYISFMSELHILDLSYNIGLSRPLPPNIGDLKKLTNLVLMGCSFSGPIPESIGSLEQIFYISLNSNQFNGTIPASMGCLSKLYWFDISDNQIEGKLPISNGISSPGLDMLLQTKHFHFGNNKLSGDIPESLFSSNMTLIHVLFNENRFTGKIPDSLGLVKTLTVLRLDTNELIGDIPSNLNNLTNLDSLDLSNNKFTGSLPNLFSLSMLTMLIVSNNTFEPSPIPSWISSLHLLATLNMEGIQLVGPIPKFLFSSMQLKIIILKRNRINGTLDFATINNGHMEYVDIQYNEITDYKPPTNKRIQVILADNPVWKRWGMS